MKNSLEEPISPERAAQLLKKIRDGIEEEEDPEPKLQTGAGAMHDWEKEKEEKEDKRRVAMN
ncbi:MAG: hypothetical protein AAB470_00975 [Patescibacteria group bacterium]